MVRSIILKKTERGEADELVFFLARELGWLRGVAKNARKSRIRFAGHLEPFSLVDLALRSRKKDDLVWIDDSQAINGFLGIRSDLGKVALAAYFLELASVLQAEGQPDHQLFDFLVDFLERLERSQVNPAAMMLSEIRLLGLLGYEPSFDTCPVCGKSVGAGAETVFSLVQGGVCHLGCTSGDETESAVSPETLALVNRGLRLDFDVASRLRIGKKGIDELRTVLSAFVRHVRGENMNSLTFLEKMGILGRNRLPVKHRGR